MAKDKPPAAAPATIMLIRHGEKPEGPKQLGVDFSGSADDHALSVRGWQRTGALAAWFASDHLSARGAARPSSVFATKPSKKAQSRREVDTATPIASRLGLDVDADAGHGEVADAAKRILAGADPVLVVWHHGELPALAKALGGADVPDQWPADRYDLVWVLTREGDGYQWAEVAQQLLPGDAPLTSQS